MPAISGLSWESIPSSAVGLSGSHFNCSMPQFPTCNMGINIDFVGKGAERGGVNMKLLLIVTEGVGEGKVLF